MRASVTALLLAAVPVVGCGEIQGAPLSEAPLNRGCPAVNPCGAYDVPNAKTSPQCNKDGRCDFPIPDYPFTVVVTVPNSSFYAPGRSFVFTSEDLRPPPGTTRPGTACVPPTCFQLPELVRAEGRYVVTKAVSQAVGLDLPDRTSIPITVAFVPLVGDTQDELASRGIPVGDVLTASRLFGQPPEVSYVDTVSLGSYRRIAYPEPPYDKFFPPAFSTLQVTERLVANGFRDEFVLGTRAEAPPAGATVPGATPIDDESGEFRTAAVTRAEGLDGWRVWLVDAPTQRRISSVRTLKGTRDEVRLDTVGQSQPESTSLRQDVDVIVAPPQGFLAVPRLQSQLVGGQGLQSLNIPRLPGPATVEGLVANADGAGLTGIPARLLFTSTRLRLFDGTPTPLFSYATAVSTDETGHFATVLPPGLYDVTIEPDERTGFSKGRDTFDTSEPTAKTYQPQPRTVASGRVLLADGRPLSEAEVVALPSAQPAPRTSVKPRPARTRTDRDGVFRFEVDQGQYDFIVDPPAGSGFPRLVQLRSFGTATADIGEVRVAPPAPLVLQLKDPSDTANPIVRAVVRVYAELPGRGPPAVEIGRSMTDAEGKCEILLAHQGR